MSTPVKVLLAVAALVVLGGGAGYAYLAATTADAPEEVGLGPVPTQPPGSGPAVASATPTGGAAESEGLLDGSWEVADDGTSFVGYRVREQLGFLDAPNDAVGRSPAVTGTLELAGAVVEAVDVTADLRELASDEDRRDRAIRTRGLESETFPEATFTLTDPIDLGELPEPGEVVTADAVGDLTAHGVTRPVTLALDARIDGDALVVAGSTPISLSDFGVEAPVLGPVVSIEDAATVELQATFVRADA